MANESFIIKEAFFIYFFLTHQQQNITKILYRRSNLISLLFEALGGDEIHESERFFHQKK